MMSKKKWFAVLLSILVFISVLVISASADTSGDYTYSLEEFSDGYTVTITKYNGSASKIVIPDDIGGYPVTKLAGSSFRNCVSIESITFPDSLTEISDSAFEGCTSLKAVNLPDSLTTLGHCVFKGCSVLSKVYIPSSLTNVNSYTWDGVFQECDALETVSFQDGIKKIPWGLFQLNNGIKKVSIPSTVTDIEGRAFNNCDGLTSVVLPDGLKTIGDYAFEGCDALKRIQIPTTVKTMGHRAFAECKSLLSTNIPKNMTLSGYIWEGPFQDCSKLNDISFEEDISIIRANLFYGCDGLTGIVIPDSVTTIDARAFEGCINLREVEIPDSVTMIKESAFNNCDSLTEIDIPESVTTIDSYAFANCDKLEQVVLPDSVTRIGNYVYEQCTSLTTVSLPDSLTTMGNDNFNGCTSLTEIKIPDSVTDMGTGTFVGCTSLESADLSKSCKYVPAHTFNGCTSLTSVVIPKACTEIRYNAFVGCKMLSTINLPANIQKIEENAFLESGLTSITIPANCSDIGNSAFENCENLSTVNLNSGLKTIAGEAFLNCKVLKNIVLPDGLENIYYKAFYGCAEIENIDVPTTVKYIGDQAFCGCTKLASITLGNITEVPYQMLADCPKLTSIVIPNTVSKIDSQAFHNDVKLVKATIPASVKEIAEDAFDYKFKLTIYGYRDTYAEEYANTYDIAFVSLDDTILITSQPVDATVKVGETAMFFVAASGNDLSYQWEYYTAANGVWKASGMTGNTTDTISIPATAKRNGQKYRCIVSDANGNTVISEEALLTVESDLAITAQPRNVSVAVGKTASFSVIATGNKISYQWQYKMPSGSWKNCTSKTAGYNAATLKVEATETRNGYQYRCVVTDNNGESISSNAATLTVEGGLTITSQPKNATVDDGEIAQFSVTATGNDLSYKWQYKMPSGSWKNCTSKTTGYNAATLKVSATTGRNNYKYRCIVTDGNDNSVTSNAATLTVNASDLVITDQPVNTSVFVGDTAKFTVKATGSNLTYQWQYYTAANGVWKNSGMTGSTTATISVPATEARNGQKYRCIVTDGSGNSVISSVATLTVESVELEIVVQPTNKSGAVGDTVVFSVTAQGAGLTYQWQYKTTSSTTWKDSGMAGNKTNNLSVPVTSARNGQKYRCVITDASGDSVITKSATLTVK